MNDQHTPPTPDSSAHGPDASAGRPGQLPFFRWVRSLGIVRGDDRWMAGVCSGIGHRIGVDPLIVRGIVVALFLMGGFGLLGYLVAWLLLPDADDRIHVEQVLQGGATPGAWVGLGAVALLLIGPIGRWGLGWGWPDEGTEVSWITVALRVIWSVAFVVGVIWLIVWAMRRSGGGVAGPPRSARAFPQDAAPRASDGEQPQYPHAAFDSAAAAAGREAGREAREQSRAAADEARARVREHAAEARLQGREAAERAREDHRRSRPSGAWSAIGFGLSLIVGGLVGWLVPLLSPSVSTLTAVALGFAAALAVLGLTITVFGFSGRRGGLLSFLAIVTGVATLLISPVSAVQWQGPLTVAGQVRWTVAPSDLQQAGEASGFRMVASTGTLDLSAVGDVPAAPTPIDVSSTASTLYVLIPDTGTFRIVTTATASSVKDAMLPGASQSERSGLGFTSVTVVRDGRIVSSTDDTSSEEQSAGTVTLNVHLVASTLHLRPVAAGQAAGADDQAAGQTLSGADTRQLTN